MAQLFDARGNEFQGQLDQIGGGTFTDARTASGALTAVNSELAMDLNGKAVATFQINTGAATTGTLVFEGTVDNSNYQALPAWEVSNETMLASCVLGSSATRIFVVGVSGFRRVRVRVSVVVAGTCTAFGRASIADFAIYTRPQPSVLHVTATAAAGGAATATLPAVAGCFHYITAIELYQYIGVALAPAAAPVLTVPTNLVPIWSLPTLAGAVGELRKIVDMTYASPLKSTAIGIASSLASPAQAGAIFRWNVSYYVGA